MPDPFINLPPGVEEEDETITAEERAKELKEMGLEETEGGFQRINPAAAPEPEEEPAKPDAEPEQKPRERSFEELADQMYGEKPKEKGTEFPSSKSEEPQKLPDRTEAEIAAVVYPEKNPLYADVDENGNVSAVIRQLGTGKILAQSRYGEAAELAARSSPLPHADLSGMKLAGKTLSHGNFHDASIAGTDCSELTATWSNLKGLNAEASNLSKANLGFSDLRGMKVSSETDISGANFNGAAIDQATYDALIRCKGANSARGLGVREMPKKYR